MKRKSSYLAVGFLLIVGLAFYSDNGSSPKTSALVPKADPSAITATSDGGLIYANNNGQVFFVDKDGKTTPIVTIEGVRYDKSWIWGLAQDKDKRLFASWMETSKSAPIIAQIYPGPTRIVYRGTWATADLVIGQLTFAPDGRIVAAISDTPTSSKLISVDPNRNEDQQATDVSKGWNKIGGFTYTSDGTLWVVDNDASADRIKITNTAAGGKSQFTTEIQSTAIADSITTNGDSGIAICFSNRNLQRFDLNGSRLSPGKVVGRQCNGNAVRLTDNRFAYISINDLRITH